MRIVGIGLAAVGLVGCSGDKESDSGLTASSDVVVTDACNYSFSGAIELNELVLLEATEFEICWDELTTTLRGNPMPDPSTVERVVLVQFAMDRSALEADIEAGTLVQSDAKTQYFLDYPGAGCVMASDLEVIDNNLVPEIDLFDEEGCTWLASIQMLEPRPDILASAVVSFQPGVPHQDLHFLDENASTIDFTAELPGASCITVPADDAPYSFDWSGMVLDAMGQPFDYLLADELIVGHIPSDDVSVIETDFVRLYEIADQLYSANVYGLAAVDDLSIAVDEAGNAFPGFTTDGTWLIALVCTLDTCTSPTPMFLAVVDVL